MNPKDAIGRKKPPISFTPARSILDMGRAMQYGAAEYGPFNWRTERISMTVYLNAAFRHLAEMLEGADIDDDSGLPHGAHVMACMAILLDGQRHGALEDDRLDKQTPEPREPREAKSPESALINQAESEQRKRELCDAFKNVGAEVLGQPGH